ncbi:MAG TPA: cytochrome P450 [Acidimicrobiales bacterium]|nr:cytochrome P450 [Acidimicrobiales bacterium]
MTLHPQTLDEIDFWDLDMFSHGDPHAAWTLLRREAPVWYHDRPGGEPFYAVTSYDDCRHIHGNPGLFSSERDGIVLRNAAALAMAQAGMENPLERNKPMIHTDPPRHQPLRKVISHNFTPRAISRLEEQIRGYAVTCLDEVAQKRDVDFVTEVAHRIPAAIALSLMGVPEQDWDRLAELEHITVTGTDPEFTHGRPSQEAQAEAGIELFGYFGQLVMRLREEPGDDLLSQLLAGVVQGEPLPWQQVVAEAGLLLAGGLDTTRAAASAGGILPLMEHPDQWEALQDDPSLLATAVDEFVRWASPITSEARTVTGDTELRGVRLKEGDRVAIWSPSCNRDENQFEDPFRFDMRRQNNRHLGFAYGEHYCLGVHLARLTLKVEFEEILRRFARIELTGTPARVHSNFVGGLKHLPVRMIPR